jgi:hypothetical protein
MKNVRCIGFKSLKSCLGKVRGWFLLIDSSKLCGDLDSAIFVNTSFSTPTLPRFIPSKRLKYVDRDTHEIVGDREATPQEYHITHPSAATYEN